MAQRRPPYRRRPRRDMSDDDLQKVSGVRAVTDGVCAHGSCDEPVLKEQRVVPWRGGWAHVSCVVGGRGE